MVDVAGAAVGRGGRGTGRRGDARGATEGETDSHTDHAFGFGANLGSAEERGLAGRRRRRKSLTAPGVQRPSAQICFAAVHAATAGRGERQFETHDGPDPDWAAGPEAAKCGLGAIRRSAGEDWAAVERSGVEWWNRGREGR